MCFTIGWPTLHWQRRKKQRKWIIIIWRRFRGGNSTDVPLYFHRISLESLCRNSNQTWDGRVSRIYHCYDKALTGSKPNLVYKTFHTSVHKLSGLDWTRRITVDSLVVKRRCDSRALARIPSNSRFGNESHSLDNKSTLSFIAGKIELSWNLEQSSIACSKTCILWTSTRRTPLGEIWRRPASMTLYG